MSIFQVYRIPRTSNCRCELAWPFVLKLVTTSLVNFQSHYNFREYTLYCVYRESAWCRESLQRRKAFEKLLPVFSPPLHCTFVSLSPLTPSFSLSLPVIPGVAYEVTVFLCWAAGLCGLMFFFFFSFWVPLICISPFWGHPFPLPHTGNHLTERHCGWCSG